MPAFSLALQVREPSLSNPSVKGKERTRPQLCTRPFHHTLYLPFLYSSSGLSQAVLVEKKGESSTLFILHFTGNLLLWTFERWTWCWARTRRKKKNGESSSNTDVKLGSVERFELRIPGTQRRPLGAHCVEHSPEHRVLPGAPPSVTQETSERYLDSWGQTQQPVWHISKRDLRTIDCPLC